MYLCNETKKHKYVEKQGIKENEQIVESDYTETDGANLRDREDAL